MIQLPKLDLSRNICFDKHVDVTLDPYNYSDPTLAISTLQDHYDYEHITVGLGIGELMMRLGSYIKRNSWSLTINHDSWAGAYDLVTNFNIPAGNDVLYIVNPHSHDGTVKTVEDIKQFATQYKMVIVDEAYGDFSDQSIINNRPDNVVVLKTMSKSLPLPGVRFGWAISNKYVNRYLNIRRPRGCVVGGLADQLPRLLAEIPFHVERMQETKEYITDITTHGNYALFSEPNKYTNTFKCNGMRMALLDMETLWTYMS